MIVLAGVLTAGACSSAGSGSSGTEGANGVLTYATDGVVQCLDPQAAATKLTAVISRNTFDSLLTTDKDGRPAPWLAEKWTVSPDGKTYTFVLRGGVVFHDGTPLDAAAVKATLDHAVDPKTRSLYASSLLSGYTGTKVVNAGTLQITLSHPYSPLLLALSSPYLGIQSPKSLQAKDGPCTHPVGSGPFKFQSWVKTTGIKLVRNDAYQWGPTGAASGGPAKLAGITFKFVSEESARYGALTSGQAQLIDDVPPEDVEALKKSGQLEFRREDVPGAVVSITFNSTRAPLNDEKVRLALRQSIDVDTLVKSIYGGQYARAWSPLSPATPGFEPTLEGTWKYDPAVAGKLLDEAGWTARDSQGYRTKAGKRLSVRWPVGSRVIRRKDTLFAQGLQAEAKKAGIEVQFLEEDTGAFIRDVLSRNLDIYFDDFRTASADILRYQFASDQLPAKGGGNMFHINDAKLDGWLQGAASTTDPAVQKADYAAAQRHLVDHALVLPVYVPAELLGLSKKVQGLTFDRALHLQFHDVTLDGR
jgi:peptide/nickel transport system substrate-binding protein